MVRIREAHSIDTPAAADAGELLARLPLPAPPQRMPLLLEAMQRVLRSVRGQSVVEGRRDPVAAALDVVETLSLLQLDEPALAAGALSVEVMDGRIALSELDDGFSAEIAAILRGVQRMEVLRLQRAGGERGRGGFAGSRQQGESLRRMLVALIDDPRVALVKLAERVQALREHRPGTRDPAARAIAHEAMDIYAPLAHRLGVGQIKWELEDLAFRHLHPDDYLRIARLLDEKRSDRERFIAAAVERLGAALEAGGISAEVAGRAKHLYSIWKKMQRKGIDFSEIYDVRALRVLVGSVADCYATLGVVHGLWRNLTQEFDDYIANPKPNGYRSLHTAVIGEGGKVLEVQIRTATMHDEAEYGICAHWHYKGSDVRQDPGAAYEEKIGWLRQVLGWGGELDTGDLLSEHLRREVGADRVYVLTPDGHVVDLPAGATPVDFAYHVHTELGHRCRGAKVDGRIVSLDQALQTGQRVEIIRGKHPAPNRDWLRTENEFVHTARARSKIRHFFREQERGELIASGRQVLERELKRFALQSPQLPQLARKLGYRGAEDMLAAIGGGELGSAQLLAVLGPEIAEAATPLAGATTRRPRRRREEAVSVAGVDNLLTQRAGCCRPLPGDPILGYVTGGRGVSVHRRSCSKLAALAANNPARIVEVNWSSGQPKLHEVVLRVVAQDRTALLRDVVNLLGNERINILDLRTDLDRNRHLASLQLSVEIASLGALARIMEKIGRVSGVLSVQRHVE